MYNLTGDTIPRQYILQRQKKKSKTIQILDIPEIYEKIIQNSIDEWKITNLVISITLVIKYTKPTFFFIWNPIFSMFYSNFIELFFPKMPRAFFMNSIVTRG